MSRSSYTDDCDDRWLAIKWRGQVASAIRGKRGQAFLRELVEALDAMPVKVLIAHDLISSSIIAVGEDGAAKPRVDVCALGAVGMRRGVALETLDPENYDKLADVFGVAHQLIQEIEYMNDEAADYYGRATPAERWQRMRDWAAAQLKVAS